MGNGILKKEDMTDEYNTQLSQLITESTAELTRDSIPSGFTQLSDLDYTYMSTNSNKIKTLTDSVAYVNGYKTKIPAETVITLNSPPTTGTRDDLVFLECWKQTDAIGAITWNSRIRVVDGANFSKLAEGLANRNEYNNVGWDDLYYPTAQGASTAPLYQANASADVNRIACFVKTDASYAATNIGGKRAILLNMIDGGLYIAGNGDSQSKTALNTTDGYVYAIPMFKVHRRNSGGYSVSNANGANSWYSIKPIGNTSIQGGNTAQVTFTDTSLLKAGDILYRSDSIDLTLQVVSVDSSTTATIKGLYSNTLIFNFSNAFYYYNKYTRQDKTYVNIIVERDIIDLRHQVSLTGFNYQALLEENFDKLLRGELQTNAKTQMLKTYHGIQKTPIDSNTVFYASLDGTTIAEVGGALNLGTGSFKPMPTGLGYKFNGDSAVPIAVSGLSVSAGTAEFLTDFSDAIGINTSLFSLLNANGYSSIFCYFASNILYVAGNNAEGTNSSAFAAVYTPPKMQGIHHIRIVWTVTKVYIYIDGILVLTKNITGTLLTPTNLLLGAIRQTGNIGAIYQTKLTISDFSISNIDRGAVFATLPQDYIDGYARIDKSFNEQRQTFSDALTSEYKNEIVKASGEIKKQYIVTQATSGAWASGDTLKVKGLGGEIITGVVDADTALAKIIQGGSSVSLIYVDDVSKFSINDTIVVYNPSTGLTDTTRTITAIDTVANTITISPVATWWPGYLIFETTPNSSSPLVKYTGGTVTGTWSGLGTTQATFTFGTNAGLTNQDLSMEYSLNEVAGQGGMPEVLTTTLAGESNGKKLTVNPTVHIRDDFAGKAYGDITVCPNIAKHNSSGGSTTLLAPSSSYLYETGAYSNINTLDNTTLSASNNANGAISQQLFSFNLIRIVEDKYGTLSCGSDIASKVAWLKANLSSIKCNWWGYGSCPSGNKAYLRCYNSPNGWALTLNNVASSPSLLTANILSTWSDFSNYIQSDGFVHFLAYTDASDGTTASTIYSDYCNIEITLSTPTGYDVLTSENPRRDDGKGNMLLVRKETKEIKTMFNRNNSDGIVTYGDYVPKQGILPTSLSLVGGNILTNPKAFLTSISTKGTNMQLSYGLKTDILDEFSIIDSVISSSLTNGLSLISTLISNMSTYIIDTSIIGVYNLYKRINNGKIVFATTSYIKIGDINNGAYVVYTDVSKIPVTTKAIPLIVMLIKDSTGNLFILISASSDKATGMVGLNTTTRMLAFQVNNRILMK